jgi:hypothetical protein
VGCAAGSSVLQATWAGCGEMQTTGVLLVRAVRCAATSGPRGAGALFAGAAVLPAAAAMRLAAGNMPGNAVCAADSGVAAAALGPFACAGVASNATAASASGQDMAAGIRCPAPPILAWLQVFRRLGGEKLGLRARTLRKHRRPLRIKQAICSLVTRGTTCAG